MCGICGYVSDRHITIEQLEQMNNAMSHRGPDDKGAEQFPMPNGKTVGLAQRRLSILDLSSMGHQPMHSKDDRVMVVYNGEIYNYRELQKELNEYSFQSNCDTEVIIAAYLKWGIQFVDHLNGMFAICLYDREDDSVFLIRDRIGKKPLYYETEKENLYFASELKPLMLRPGFQKRIRKEIVSRYLYQQYINAPDSIFENVHKLSPGSILQYRNGRIKIWKYWDVKTVYHQMQQNPVTEYCEAKETLKKLLKESVKRRRISDVPLGTFLSGGYDSSLITAMAQECSDHPVQTFSIGFQNEQYNEAGYAKEVAKELGTEHTELYISEKEMYDMVDSIPKYYDEPMADSSQIPTMLVAELAKKDVTVVLSGDGGDEFFCGYNLYEKIRQAQKLDMAGGLVHGICNCPGLKQVNLEARLPFAVRVIDGNRNKQTKTQFGVSNYLSMADQMVLGEGIPCNYETEQDYHVDNWQIRRMLLDMDTYLPGDILCKVDRATMKYSLEARCPIMDRDVMEYSFRIAHSFKYQKGNKKRILKDIAYDYIPKELLDRPKKGFAVPLAQWLQGPLKEELLDMCQADFLKKQDIFDASYVGQLVTGFLKTGDAGSGTGRNYSGLIWSFFVFQQWYQKYIL